VGDGRGRPRLPPEALHRGLVREAGGRIVAQRSALSKGNGRRLRAISARQVGHACKVRDTSDSRSARIRSISCQWHARPRKLAILSAANRGPESDAKPVDGPRLPGSAEPAPADKSHGKGCLRRALLTIL
jgi:hypothetical protein